MIKIFKTLRMKEISACFGAQCKASKYDRVPLRGTLAYEEQEWFGCSVAHLEYMTEIQKEGVSHQSPTPAVVKSNICRPCVCLCATGQYEGKTQKDSFHLMLTIIELKGVLRADQQALCFPGWSFILPLRGH